MMAAAVHCLTDNVWYCCIFIYCSLSIWGLLKVFFSLHPIRQSLVLIKYLNIYVIHRQ